MPTPHKYRIHMRMANAIVPQGWKHKKPTRSVIKRRLGEKYRSPYLTLPKNVWVGDGEYNQFFEQMRRIIPGARRAKDQLDRAHAMDLPKNEDRVIYDETMLLHRYMAYCMHCHRSLEDYWPYPKVSYD